MDVLTPLADNEGATVVLGVNVDDLGDHRPGQQVASERGARFPLVEAGFTKGAVRQASKALGLRTWDKPAAACLASRIPYGTPVTAPTSTPSRLPNQVSRLWGSARSAYATMEIWRESSSASTSWTKQFNGVTR